MRPKILCLLISQFLMFAGCGGIPGEGGDDETLTLFTLAALNVDPCAVYDWNLPPGFPVPVVPADNCQTYAKEELGHLLFYDRNLSFNNTVSCASCHQWDYQFRNTNPMRGAPHPGHPHGQATPYQTPKLWNVAYVNQLTRAGVESLTLEEQAKLPLYRTNDQFGVVEMGQVDGSFVEGFRREPLYQERFARAFGSGSESITEENMRKALAAFQRTLISGASPYDLYLQGYATLSTTALRGAELFFSDRTNCSKCHGGLNFNEVNPEFAREAPYQDFQNNGLHSTDVYAGRQLSKQGLAARTGNPAHLGMFRVPSLRHLRRGVPYMHDGSVHCTGFLPDCDELALRKAIEFYEAGPALDSGGDPMPNVNTELLRPFTLNDEERDDLVHFLLSLDDPTLMHERMRWARPPFPGNPRFANDPPEHWVEFMALNP